MSHLINDVFGALPSTSWQVHESKEDSVVDGVNILARAQGPFFLVDGASRNGRFYPKSLWEKVITKTKNQMETGTMLGTIGHDTELDDKALLEGKASHRVTKLWIDEKAGIGMGEVLVLNTPAGRNLNSYLRGGVRFPVSSRATGDYTGKKVQGANELNPDTFQLERFDFVRVPGVETAVPHLIESHTDDSANNHVGEDDMGDANNKEILEQLARDKIAVQNELDSALAANKHLENKVAVAEDKLATANEKAADVKKQLDEANQKLVVLADGSKLYEGLGDATSAVAKMAKLDELVTKLGAYDIDVLVSTSEALAELGSVDDISSVFESFEKLVSEHGSLPLLIEKLEAVQGLNGGEVTEKFAALEKFEELGTLEEVTEALEAALKVSTDLQTERNTSKVKQLTTETGIPETTASRILEQMGMDFDAAKDLINSIAKKEELSDRFRVKKPKSDDMNEDEQAKDETNEELNEDEEIGDDRPSALHESRSMRLFNSSNGLRNLK